MASRGQIIVTVGASGSGKTYRRCAHYLVNDFFREYDGRLFTNFPLGVIPDDHRPTPPRYEGETYADRIAEEVERRGYCSAQDVRDRIVLIPDDVLKTWREGTSGPWEYFHDVDLDGSRIMIDEIHNFAGRDKKPKILAEWAKFNGEARHRGAQCEYLSQHPTKVAKEINREGDLQIYLSNMESARDPVFRIPYGEWWELQAKFITGRYQSIVVETEKSDHEGRWVTRERRPILIEPKYFDFYDSTSKPAAGGRKGSARKREYERRNMLSLLWWFVSRNAFRIVPRVAIVAAGVWFFLGGGIGTLAHGVATATAAGFSMKQEADPAKPTPAPTAQRERSDDPAPSIASAATAEPATAGRATPTRDAATDPALREAMAATRVAIDSLRLELAASRAEADALRDQLTAAMVRAESAEAQLAHAAAVVAVTSEAVTLRIGYSYAVGERIDFGPYIGRTVRSIDWPRRTAELDDGTVVRMSNPSAGLHGGGQRPGPAAGLSDVLRPAAINPGG